MYDDLSCTQYKQYQHPTPISERTDLFFTMAIQKMFLKLTNILIHNVVQFSTVIIRRIPLLIFLQYRMVVTIGASCQDFWDLLKNPSITQPSIGIKEGKMYLEMNNYNRVFPVLVLKFVDFT